MCVCVCDHIQCVVCVCTCMVTFGVWVHDHIRCVCACVCACMVTYGVCLYDNIRGVYVWYLDTTVCVWSLTVCVYDHIVCVCMCIHTVTYGVCVWSWPTYSQAEGIKTDWSDKGLRTLKSVSL